MTKKDESTSNFMTNNGRICQWSPIDWSRIFILVRILEILQLLVNDQNFLLHLLITFVFANTLLMIIILVNFKNKKSYILEKINFKKSIIIKGSMLKTLLKIVLNNS